MNTATLDVLSSAGAGVGVIVPPIVLIDGQPSVELWVVSLSMAGPLDRRRATLGLRRGACGRDAWVRARAERYRGARVTVLQPIGLSGGENRLMPLMAGRIASSGHRLSADAERIELTAACDWSRALDSGLNPAAGRRPGEGPLTLGGVLEELNEARAADGAGLGLSLELLDGAERRRMMESPPRGRTRGDALGRVLEEHGLFVRRSLLWDGSGVRERRLIQPIRRGRPVRLATGERASGAAAVEAVRGEAPARRPIKRVARVRGRVVEATFELAGGWNPADAGLADAQYARSTSGDFDRVARVFRLWVLNEDGAYSGEPFAAGPAFDLTALFDEGRAVPPRPLPFGDALTRDASGRSVGVVVEASVDGGVSWSRYPGPHRVLEDRAGVSLEGDALPGDFLAAAKAGAARVRATATLRSPLAIERVRWRGNPFAGAFEERTHRLGDRFAYRRVGPSSRYFGAVASGSRTADEVDERGALSAWLVERDREAERAGGRADVEVVGPALGLRIGDRLDRSAGRRIGVEAGEPAGGGAGPALMRLIHRWDRGSTALRWES